MRLALAGRVGVPRTGEMKCPRCKGHGQTGKRTESYPGYEGCDRCEGTGVVKQRLPA